MPSLYRDKLTLKKGMWMMRGKEGVTLLEVMVVVVIVGILAAVAIPAYNNYITRARRSAAFTALETVRAAQEMYRAEKGFYVGINQLPGCSSGMAGNNYIVTVLDVTATTFTVDATPMPEGRQAGDFIFTVDQDGVKKYNGIKVNSWEDLPRH
jgi:type IV pilus assembly protein PilE